MRLPIAVVLAAGLLSCWLVQSGPAACPGSAGPSMVRVGTYCIDSTEVTNGQYAAFLAAKGTSTAGQPPECSTNTFETGSDIACSLADPSLPVTCIDWCDAHAYCEWAGKRLCGHIGGGPIAPSEIGAANLDEWTGACTGGDARAYGYGSAFDATACNVPPGTDVCNGSARTPSGSLVRCVGGVPGVFDLIGNVYEVEDSCSGSTGSADLCKLRGGAWLMCGTTAGADATCTFSIDIERGDPRSANVGIRCCADL